MMAMATKRLLLSLGVGAVLATSLTLLRPASRTTAPTPELAPVLVVERQVPAYQALGPADLSFQRRPVAHVPPGAVGSLQEALGKYPKTELYPGEVVLAAKLAGSQEARASLPIPAGLRAVTVSANEVSGVGGFVQPASRVDVIATWELGGKPTTRILLQNVLVIAVAQGVQAEDKPKVPSSVTLAVEPTSVERLVLASERGSIRLAMRAPDEERVVVTSGTTPESLAARPAPPPPRVRIVRRVVPAASRERPAAEPPVVVLRGEPSAPEP